MSLDEYVNKDHMNRKRYIFKHLVASVISEHSDLKNNVCLDLTREDFKYIMQLVREGYVVKSDTTEIRRYKLYGTKYNFKTTMWGLTDKGMVIAIKSMNREGVII